VKTKYKLLIVGFGCLLGAFGVDSILAANARKQTRMATMMVQHACEMYHDRWGTYPGVDEPPVNLPWQPIKFGSRLHDGGEHQKCFIDLPAYELSLRDNAIIDSWGNPMAFKFTAAWEKFEVKSLGPDGKGGTSDDIFSVDP
jgi:hypothetical protein